MPVQKKAPNATLSNGEMTSLLAYQCPQAADRLLSEARSAALVWHPEEFGGKVTLMADPRSRLRRRLERRDRALARLNLLKQALKDARAKKVLREKGLPFQDNQPLLPAGVACLAWLFLISDGRLID